MIDAIKEVSCTQCLHQEVCKYKQDFLGICNAMLNSVANRPSGNEHKVNITPIANFDCLSEIKVECRYYSPQCITPRSSNNTNYPDVVTNPCTTITNSLSAPFVIKRRTNQ